MTYMDKALSSHLTAHDNGTTTGQVSREPLVLVVEDGVSLSEAFRMICECLGIAVERLPSTDDLTVALRNRRPMLVVAEMDAVGQDGCNILMTVAPHDRDLPVLLIVGPDPALLGAVDAVEEIWGLSSVEKWPNLPGIGAIVDLLFRAGRKGQCMRLMSV
jgi:PleD family two-component response regulator